MKFIDIPGNQAVKQALRDIADSDRIPHAILLSGPSGAGKMMLARAFAQYVHCLHPEDGEPCGRCQACRLHEDLTHPDMHFVYPVVKKAKEKLSVSADYAAQWKQMLRDFPEMPEEEWLDLMKAENSRPAIFVDEADEIIRADSYPPFTAKRKIFVIWLPEKMRAETANKLLKVIEEPSEGTVFILVSDNELQLLPTIFSRTQRYHVGRVSESDMAGFLSSRYGIDPLMAPRLAHIAAGSLIEARRLGANSAEAEQFRQTYMEIMRSAYAKKVQKLRQIADTVAGFGREKIRRFLDFMARMVRENFIYNLRMPQLSALTPEEEEFSKRFSPFVNHLNVEDFAAETDRARIDIERNANSKIVLFDFFLTCIILLHRKER